MTPKSQVGQSNLILTPYSKRFVTLLDIMKELQVDRIYQLREVIKGLAGALKSRERNSPLTRNEQKTLLRFRDGANLDPFGDLGGQVASHVFLLKVTLKHKSLYKFREHIIGHFEQLERAVFDSLFKTTFVGIDSGKSKYFDQQHLFGEKVSSAFPIARDDIKDAGNCIAADLNTAAVFHLMRVAEFGLKKLARKLRVKIKHGIDLSEWGAILDGLKKSLAILENAPRTKRRERQLIYYYNVYDDLKGIKHLWRNPVMHARGVYNENDALGAFGRVKDLMQRLSEGWP